MKIGRYSLLACGLALFAIGCNEPPAPEGTGPAPAYEPYDAPMSEHAGTDSTEPATHPDPLDPNPAPTIPESAADDPTQPGGLLPPEPAVEGKSRYTDAEPQE